MIDANTPNPACPSDADCFQNLILFVQPATLALTTFGKTYILALLLRRSTIELSSDTSHWMTPLLAPKSIALVGGSRRQGSVGNRTIKALVKGGFPGELNIINPQYDDVEGFPCFAALSDLPQPPDMAILSVSAHRMENIMTGAIDAGIRSAVIFDPCFFKGDTTPPILDRLKAMVDASIEPERPTGAS